jgi:hypothetical protein
VAQQGLLERPVEQRVDGVGRADGRAAGQLGVAGDDVVDHALQQAVDLQHVGAEGLLEQGLGAQVVPEPVGGGVDHERVRHGLRERPASPGPVVAASTSSS